MNEIKTVDAAIAANPPLRGSDRRKLAAELGVDISVVVERYKAFTARKGTRIKFTVLTVVLAVVGGLVFQGMREAGRPQSGAGASSETERRYNDLPPEGQKHFDDQMEKYDNFCADSDEC